MFWASELISKNIDWEKGEKELFAIVFEPFKINSVLSGFSFNLFVKLK